MSNLCVVYEIVGFRIIINGDRFSSDKVWIWINFSLDNDIEG